MKDLYLRMEKFLHGKNREYIYIILRNVYSIYEEGSPKMPSLSSFPIFQHALWIHAHFYRKWMRSLGWAD